MKLLLFTRKVDSEDTRIGFMHRWITELSSSFEKIHVVCLEAGRMNLPKNVVVHPLGKGKLRRFLTYQKLLISLRKDIDIIFCHMNPIYPISTAPLSKLFGKPLVYWYAHGEVSSKLRLSVALSNKVITSSWSGMKIDTKKRVIIGQAIDTDKFKPLTKKSKDITILSLGRISPVKGYHTLIEAMPQIMTETPKAKLRIVGNVETQSERNYLNKLERMVKELGLRNRVSLHDGVPHSEVLNMYRDSDIMASDSQTGSLDKVTLEAMSAGRMVLVSNKAFEEVLGPLSKEMTFKANDSNDFAAKATHLLKLSTSERSKRTKKEREIIIKNHNFKTFIKRLAKEIK